MHVRMTLGKAGADADTGLGRMDVGCMASRIYAASMVVEEKEEVPTVVNPAPPVTVAVKQPVVSPPAEKEIVKEKKVPEKSPSVTVSVDPVPRSACVSQANYGYYH